MSKIIASCPHFFVKDLRAAVDHYHEVFGFTKPSLWGDPPGFAMPSRDGFIVMLNQVDDIEPRPNGLKDCWDAYFWCVGVDELFEDFRRRGATVAYEPADQELYGMREFAVRDLDGYLLAFAEDLHPEEDG